MPQRSAVFVSRLVFALALLPGLVRGATNLIPNPGFESDLNQWIVPFGSGPSLAWTAVDELGKTSGSARFSPLPASTMVPLDSACFPVVPGSDLVFGAGFWSSAQPGQGGVYQALLRLFDGAGCAGDPQQQALSDLQPYFATSSNWRPLQGHVTAGPATQSGSLRLYAVGDGALDEVRFDNAFVYADSACATTSTVTCLGDRFRVAIEWAIPDGTRGGALLRAFSSDSLRASFFNSANVEVVLKVLDGCSLNDRYWVFAAGLTNVGVVVRVTDTRTGLTWTRLNPQDEPFAPVQDTTAFATCDE
jgi:hypothetical protein